MTPIDPIFGPVLVQVALTVTVLFWLAYARFSFIGREGIATVRDKGFPPRAVQASDNFKNQFEVPVLFYVLAVFFAVAGETTPLVLFLAWVFAGARVLHALVQLTTNVIFPWRFGFFFLSGLCVLGLTILAWAQMARGAVA